MARVKNNVWALRGIMAKGFGEVREANLIFLGRAISCLTICVQWWKFHDPGPG